MNSFSGANAVSVSPQPLKTDGASINITPGDVSQLTTAGVPLIFPGAMGGKIPRNFVITISYIIPFRP